MNMAKKKTVKKVISTETCTKTETKCDTKKLLEDIRMVAINSMPSSNVKGRSALRDILGLIEGHLSG
tara:strand:+ start:3366 stop:3566 length:201 start_codon:yes stop_codon:yes gene_type:complete